MRVLYGLEACYNWTAEQILWILWFSIPGRTGLQEKLDKATVRHGVGGR